MRMSVPVLYDSKLHGLDVRKKKSRLSCVSGEIQLTEVIMNV